MDKLQKQMRVKDQDAEREKILSRMQQDDFLLKQIDEFKEKYNYLKSKYHDESKAAPEYSGNQGK